LVALYAQRGPLLGAWGAWWVVNEPLEKSQAIVVLGGDSPAGDRVRHAVELYRQGWAPQIVCSGTLLRYDFSESTLMESEARRMGVPGDALLVVPASGESTLEEALVLRRFLTEHKLNRIIVVTSDFHTRRSRTILRKVLGQAGFDVRLSACSDVRFSPRTWWQQREGKKQMVLEILKSVVTWWELRQVPREGTP
jgi:uncharacterized SAM-binding protein YcdF (DUF218 family)